jgi:hypothetical protein
MPNDFSKDLLSRKRECIRAFSSAWLSISIAYSAAVARAYRQEIVSTGKRSFVENAAKTIGVLTVSSGTLRASVTLFGQYVAGERITNRG